MTDAKIKKLLVYRWSGLPKKEESEISNPEP
jgi:hypothetical protein